MLMSIAFMYVCVLALVPFIGLAMWLLSERERGEAAALRAAADPTPAALQDRATTDANDVHLGRFPRTA